VLFAREHRQFPRVPVAVLGAEPVHGAVLAILPRKLRRYGDAPRFARVLPPPGALLSLRTSRKLPLPIDLESRNVIAFRLLRVMAVLLDGTDNFDTMLLVAFENQRGADVCAIHKLASGK